MWLQGEQAGQRMGWKDCAVQSTGTASLLLLHRQLPGSIIGTLCSMHCSPRPAFACAPAPPELSPVQWPAYDPVPVNEERLRTKGRFLQQARHRAHWVGGWQDGAMRCVLLRTLFSRHGAARRMRPDMQPTSAPACECLQSAFECEAHPVTSFTASCVARHSDKPYRLWVLYSTEPSWCVASTDIDCRVGGKRGGGWVVGGKVRYVQCVKSVHASLAIACVPAPANPSHARRSGSCSLLPKLACSGAP